MIDVGELLLASIGISRVIADDMPKISATRMREALDIEKKIPRLASDLVNRELDHTPMERPHSYKQLLAKFDDLAGSVDVGALVRAFPREYGEESVRFSVAVQHALKDLQSVFPRQSYVTLMGPKVLEPPTVQQADFYFVFDVVNDPLRVFPLMSVGGLLPRQRDMVNLVYPGIASAITNAITEEMIKAGARKQDVEGKSSFDITQETPRGFGIATWRQQRVAPYSPPKPVLPEGTQPAKTKTARKKNANAKNVALDKATPSQKLDAGV